MSADYCELCDLPSGWCVHTGESSRRQRRANVGTLDVSPRGIAHLPGCTHKDDDDFSQWARITRDTAAAWQALGNGNPVTCDAGAQPSAVAERRCRDCEVS